MAQEKGTYSLADMQAYLQEALPAAEMAAMEAALRQDPLLAGAMEALEEDMLREQRSDQDLHELVSSFRSALPADGRQEKKEAPVMALARRPLLRYAAAVILLCLAGVIAWQQWSSPMDEQQLFAAHFEPYEDLLSVRSEAQANAPLQQAMEHYNAGNWEEAYRSFQPLVESASEDPFVLLYAANVSLQLEKSQQAIQLLQSRNIAGNMPCFSLWQAGMYLWLICRPEIIQKPRFQLTAID